MNIAIIINRLSRGGAERQIYYLARELQRSNTDLTIIALGERTEYQQAFEKLGITVKNIQLPRGPFSFLKKIAALTVALKKIRPDIVHAWLYHPNLFATIVRPFSGSPKTIVSERNISFWQKSKHRLLSRWAYHRADAILVNASAIKEELIRYYGVDPEKISFIPNGIDTNVDLNESNIPEHLHKLKMNGYVIAGAVGRFTSQKRYEDLIYAAREVLKKFSRIHFIFVGGRGELEKYRKIVCQTGLEENITFIGEVSNPLEYINIFDFFCHASSAEGMPNVLMEAMLLGKAVVAADAGGVSDLIIDGYNGLLVPPKRPDLLADSILKLVNEPQTRVLYGERSKKRIHRFSVETMVQKM